jgi:hypothetical protein
MTTTNKTNLFGYALTVACLTLTLSAPALAQGGPPWNAPRQNAPVVTEALTAEEKQDLQFMREEEKLARDVYAALSAEWKLSVFDRISASEDNHFNAIGRLLARYGVDDPAKNDVPGVFVNPDLTALYGTLMTKGKLSAKDALEVGVAIEKVDIADLEKALIATTKTDIKRVYSNLLEASLSHQEAFETNLEAACLNP